MEAEEKLEIKSVQWGKRETKCYLVKVNGKDFISIETTGADGKRHKVVMPYMVAFDIAGSIITPPYIARMFHR